MARRVIVFGAGASASFGVPTMEGFIDAAEDLRDRNTEGLSKPQFDFFLDELRHKLKPLHAKTAVDLSNIENLCGLVEMARVIRRLPGLEEGQIDNAADAVQTVLAETILHSGPFSYSRDDRWQPPGAYLSVVGRLDAARQAHESDDTAFITFNYDLGLDFALHWSNFAIDYGLGAPVDGAARLYKLHGSLNWMTCNICGHVRVAGLDQVFRSHSISQRFGNDMVRLPLDPRRAFSTFGAHCPGDNLPHRIALIPPTWNKTQYATQMSSVWQRAARELGSAQEVIVIGYSLPESDGFFRDLLALGLEGPTTVRSFLVVNPDAKVSGRFGALLGPEVRRRLVSNQSPFEVWVKSQQPKSPRTFVV
jgi:hypothetical protein